MYLAKDLLMCSIYNTISVDPAKQNTVVLLLPLGQITYFQYTRSKMWNILVAQV